MPPPSRRISGSQPAPVSQRVRAVGAPPASSRRMPAVPPSSGSTRSLQRPGAAPQQPNPRGGPPGQKKDNTPMIVGGVSVGLLLLVGIGFAMSGDKKVVKKEAPKPEVKVEAPKPAAYDPWNDPSMMGSESEQAKRRKAGMNEQNKTGEVDRTKVGNGGK